MYIKQFCSFATHKNGLNAVSGAGSSPTLATCETSQILIADVPGAFTRGCLFLPSTDWPSHMS